MPEPEPTPGTVKVKVGFNGICGTDLHEYYAGPIFVPTEPHPLTGQQLPLTMGHEFSGTITDVGAGRHRLRPRATGWRSNRSTGADTARRVGPATTTSAPRSASTA